MGSSAIFVCHRCLDVRGTSCNYPKELERKSIFRFKMESLFESGDFVKYWGFFKQDDETQRWMCEHRGHDVDIISDGYGTYNSSNYNFEKRKMEFDPYE